MEFLHSVIMCCGALVCKNLKNYTHLSHICYMKYTITFILFLFSLCAISQQQDTIITDNGKTITGQLEVFSDRITVDDGQYNWMIMKDRIKSLSVRSVMYKNNVRTINYITDPNALNLPNAPQYKDFKHYLKNGGAYGVTSAVMIIGGSILSAIGAATNDRNVAIYGTAIGATGTAFLIPTFVFVLKAGKAKSYRIP